MEGILQSEASNPISPETVVDVSCNRELARSSSDASSPTPANRKYTLRCSSNMAPDENETWTNEKHNLYLNHLELSFVTQLNQSKSLLHKRLTNVKNASEKFKGLRNGCCRTSHRAKLVCNFNRVGKNCHSPSAEMAAGSMELWSTEKYRKSTISSGLATCSQDLLNLEREEGTGQNFLDGVIQSTSKFESGPGKKVENSFSGELTSGSSCSF